MHCIKVKLKKKHVLYIKKVTNLQGAKCQHTTYIYIYIYMYNLVRTPLFKYHSSGIIGNPII